MSIFEFDFMSLFTLTNLAYIFLGRFVGLLMGAIPGLGAIMAIVFLLPLTYNLEPVTAILLLLAAFQAAEYGGSISAIVLGIPGTPTAAATVLDGNALARSSSPGKALAYSLTASTIGGLAGGLVLLFLSVPFANFAIKLSASEFFLLGLLGMLAVPAVSSGKLVKSLIAAVLGLMTATIGMDMFTGSTRFTMGVPDLMEGIGIITLMVGLFAFPEIFQIIKDDLYVKYVSNSKGLKTSISFKEFKSVSKSIGIGSTYGSILGILPGFGAVAASWFSYATVKKISKDPDSFGKGNPEGIAAPEAANNATVGGAMVPLLALGIPGSVGIAVIMGAFIIHGIQPGPLIFKNDSNLVYGIMFGFLLTTIAMFILGKALTPVFSRVLTVPNTVLVPIIALLSIVAIYAESGSSFNLWIALLIGLAGFFLKLLDYSLASFVIAFVLGPIIEENFIRALILSEGSYSIFFTRPMSLVILLIILAVLIVPVVQKMRRKRIRNKAL